MPDVEQYQSALTGPQMDQALLDMANHTSERYAKGTAEGVPVSPGTVGYEDNSKYYKDLAANQAQAATSSASQAVNYATAAQTSAAAAAASATTANTEAYRATVQADRAEDAADRAEAIVGGEFVSYGQPQGLNDTQKAQARENIGAEISEEKTATPGAIVTFNDGAAAPLEALEVELAIDQDLNGYAYPWPAGGGKNLYNIENQTSNVNNTFLVINVAANTTYTFSVDISQNALYAQYDNGGTWTRFATAYTKTFLTFNSGEYTTIRLMTYNTSGLPSKFQLELGTAATDWVPYANVCPITPHTEVNITRAGKNLLQFWENRSHNGVDFTLTSNGSMLMTGTATGVAYAAPSNAQRTILPAGTYKISGGLSSDIRLYIGGTYEDGTALPSAIDTGNGADVTYTKKASVYFQIRVATGTDTTGQVIFPMLRLASIENDTYEACNKQIYTVELGGEYYAGTLDVKTGRLTVTHGFARLTGSNVASVSVAGSAHYAQFALSPQGVQASVNMACNMYIPASAVVLNAVRVVSSGNTLRAYDNEHCQTLADAQAFYNSNPLELVYELATPLVIQLTPTEVQALNGFNTIWVDSGDILALAYRTKGSIQLEDFADLLAETTAGAGTSNKNLLDNGSFLINQRGVNGTLSSGYGLDRWIVFASGGSVSYDATTKAVTLTATSNVAYLQQKAEDDLRAALNGKTVTFSVLTTDGIVYKNTFTYDASAHDSGPYFPDNPKLRFWYGGDYALCLRVEATYAITIKRIKLELGNKSTIANDVPDIAEELATCQRFGTEYTNTLTGGISLASSISSTDSSADIMLTLPATLRATPTITVTGAVTLFNPAGYNFAVSSVTVAGIMNNRLLMRCNASGLTQGTVYRLVLNAGTKIYISSDL